MSVNTSLTQSPCLLDLVRGKIRLKHYSIRTEQAYVDWINELKDRASRSRIQVRVDRLAHGNPGQHRNLTHGVSELKIDTGPGYRVYYTERNGELIILLAGGDKSTQQQDIKTAITLASNLQE